MILLASSNSTKIPPCPKKARSDKYRLKDARPKDSDGTEYYFEVLPTRTAAFGFIMSVLRDMEFPMAADQHRLSQYQDDPSFYREEMQNWVQTRYVDDDTVTYFYIGDDVYELSSDTGLEEAIAAYKAAPYVTSLIQSNSSTTVLFGGYIAYEPYYNDWEGMLDPPSGVDAESVSWKRLVGTQTQIQDVDVNNREEEPYAT